MKLQDMPILDRMYPGASFKTTGPNGLMNMRVTKEAFDYLASFKRFKLDSNQRTETPEEGDVWDARKLFGHLALPFPKVWIEWDNRRESEDPALASVWSAIACVEAKDAKDFFRIMTGGGSFNLTDHLETDHGPWVAFPFWLVNGIPFLLPTPLIAVLDENRMLSGLLGWDAISRKFGADEWGVAVDLCWDGLSAIGWLNCRNVTTEEHDRSKNVKRRRRPNRDKAATLSFNTIKLPGLEEARIGGSPGGKTDTVAMHMARGHFKTFTDEAPLFGKYTGTYWWGWQVRGNRKNGEVVADYKIAKDVAQ